MDDWRARPLSRRTLFRGLSALGTLGALGGTALGAALAACVPGQEAPAKGPEGAATINILYGGGGQLRKAMMTEAGYKGTTRS